MYDGSVAVLAHICLTLCSNYIAVCFVQSGLNCSDIECNVGGGGDIGLHSAVCCYFMIFYLVNSSQN